jgi:hypothetical protein
MPVKISQYPSPLIMQANSEKINHFIFLTIDGDECHIAQPVGEQYV